MNDMTKDVIMQCFGCKKKEKVTLEQLVDDDRKYHFCDEVYHDCGSCGRMMRPAGKG